MSVTGSGSRTVLNLDLCNSKAISIKHLCSPVATRREGCPTQGEAGKGASQEHTEGLG